VVVFNDALARYISFVLPALGVNGVAVTTFHAWARKHRLQHVKRLPDSYTDDAPEAVVRLKKHPAWPKIIDDRASKLEAAFEQRVHAELGEEAQAALRHWRASEGQATALRARQLLDWATNNEDLRTGFRHALEREARALIERTDVVLVWAELLTDRRKLYELFGQYAPGDFTEGQIDTVFRWCTQACGMLVADIEQREEERAEKNDEPELDESEIGADGMEERSAGALDWEDDALLLRIYQRLRSPLRRGKDVLSYEHVFVDEAQDLSPLELAVVLGTSRSDSVTLAGDVAQRLMLDNGFSDWKSVLDILGLSHVEIEPLNVSYRSTHEIMEFANHVLGPLRPPQVGRATRHGVPVELFRFSHTGEAVGFLAESLRALCAVEPLASVAVISRTPEQARVYAEGLQHAEVPNVRLIAEQDFPFRAGIDVTDVRQVKGLEFDYVVLVEVTAPGYPDDDESRHLLHIGASRAAHQLWIVTGDQPSLLLPPELCERGY
ncbi:MAG TPA: ATP-binding domain-containing protein, partial [Polyangiales bacterium]|nr:ATP-binding domain-containing protein [Polyangiales bacterium]